MRGRKEIERAKIMRTKEKNNEKEAERRKTQIQMNTWSS